jgi:hypothetical protein
VATAELLNMTDAAAQAGVQVSSKLAKKGGDTLGGL